MDFQVANSYHQRPPTTGAAGACPVCGDYLIDRGGELCCSSCGLPAAQAEVFQQKSRPKTREQINEERMAKLESEAAKLRRELATAKAELADAKARLAVLSESASEEPGLRPIPAPEVVDDALLKRPAEWQTRRKTKQEG